VWGREAVQGAVVAQFSHLVGSEGATLIQTMIENANRPAAGRIALVIGIVTLFLGATGTFVQLKDALNTVWEVKIEPLRGWRNIWRMIRTYVLSFGMVLVIAFLLLLTLVVSAALAALGKWTGQLLPIPPWLMHALDLATSLAVLTFLFALLFKVLPDAAIQWRDVWIGAAVTSLLFTLGKFALGLYLGRSAAASVFGAAGSVVVILLWIYYASMIFLLGAEYTQVFARLHGSRIENARSSKSAVSKKAS
jgi:membrane protein